MTSGKSVTVDVIDKAAEKLAAEMEKKAIGKAQRALYVELAAVDDAFHPTQLKWLDDDVIGLMNMVDALARNMEARAREAGVPLQLGKTSYYEMALWLTGQVMRLPLDKRDAALAWIRNGDGVTK